MSISRLTPKSQLLRLRPFGADPMHRPEGLAANPPDNVYGGCSIQVFDPKTNCGNLSYTHGDANGFLNYGNQFDQINFHYEDSGVKEWEYSPTYDDWQGKYGMDAVKVFYHSGHGGMDGSGVFSAPMGAAWNNQDWATSSGMSLGDQFLRYLFWSTCESVEVLNGQTPIKTWNPVNKGLRMILGFQSTSVDSADYGSNFFSKWNTGISFSQAWQEASIAISANQQVSSTACGATQAECQNRLWNERMFYGDAASQAWYWWRWGGNAPGSHARAASLSVPETPRRVAVARRMPDAKRLATLLSRYGLEAAEAPKAGATLATAGGTTFALLPDGSHAVTFAEPDRSAPLAPHDKLRAAADAVLRQHGIDGGLVFDRATATFHAGGAVNGPVSETAVADVTFHYRQVIDGVAVVMGGDGHLNVTVDPSGALTRIIDTTREVTATHEAAPHHHAREPKAALQAETDRTLRVLAASGTGHDSLTVVPGTAEVGYRLTEAGGVLVARQEIEVTTGRFRKRHIVETPL